jgi:hypothetical protein
MVAGQLAVRRPHGVKGLEDPAGLGQLAGPAVLGDVAEMCGEDDVVRVTPLDQVPQACVQRRPVTAVQVEQVLGVRDHAHVKRGSFASVCSAWPSAVAPAAASAAGSKVLAPAPSRPAWISLRRVVPVVGHAGASGGA